MNSLYFRKIENSDGNGNYNYNSIKNWTRERTVCEVFGTQKRSRIARNL